MNKERLAKRIDEWRERVVNTEERSGTYQMVKDIDRILAEEFEHDLVLG